MSAVLSGSKKIEQSFEIAKDFIASQFGFSVNAIDEGDGNFAYCETLLTCANNHLHLKKKPAVHKSKVSTSSSYVQNVIPHCCHSQSYLENVSF